MTARVARAAATDAAAALLGRLVERGVRHIVLSPGSRSQALALVAAELEQRAVVDVHVRLDERVAAFTALGIGRESGVPAIVLCTSGTAAANLLPAVLEAHHAGVPLIVLTADRPPEIRGVGANQTTRQPGMYGSSTRFAEDLPVPSEVDESGDAEQTTMLRELADAAFDAALGAGNRSAGAAHVNLPYREPLSGAMPPWLLSASDAPARVAPPTSGNERADTDAAEEDSDAAEVESSGALYQGGGGIGEADVPGTVDEAPFVLERGPRTVVIAGADAGAPATALAEAAGFPLIAEIVSGARFGRLVVHRYREALAEEALGGRVERAVVFGHPTLSREVAHLLSREDLEVVVVRARGEVVNLNGRSLAVDAVDLGEGSVDRDWLGEWMWHSHANAPDLAPAAPDVHGLHSTEPRVRREALNAEVGAAHTPLDRELLVDAVWRATWPHDRLMFASSRLVRVADRILPGKRVAVHANRGLAGIDGTVSTALGIAIASQADGAPGVTRAIVGDLALLHDVGALDLPAQEREPRIQLIVGNDGGGSIFDALEVAESSPQSAFDRVMFTPHQVRLESLATAYGWEYQRVSSRTALDQALVRPVGGRQLIEVALERSATDSARMEL